MALTLRAPLTFVVVDPAGRKPGAFVVTPSSLSCAIRSSALAFRAVRSGPSAFRRKAEGLHTFVLTQFRTQNRYALLLEFLSKLMPSSFAISVLRSSMDFSRTVRAVLLTGTWGGRDTATPRMFSAAHCLKRGSLFGPLMGKV